MKPQTVNPEELDLYFWAVDEIGNVGWHAGVTGKYDHERSKFWHGIAKELEQGDADKAQELHHLYQLRRKIFNLA